MALKKVAAGGINEYSVNIFLQFCFLYTHKYILLSDCLLSSVTLRFLICRHLPQWKFKYKVIQSLSVFSTDFVLVDTGSSVLRCLTLVSRTV